MPIYNRQALDFSNWFFPRVNSASYSLASSGASGLIMQACYDSASGNLSSRLLASMGHPYSVSYFGSRPDPEVINSQDGGFSAGFVLIAPAVYTMSGFPSVVFGVRNVSRQAALLDRGTMQSIARPFRKKIAEQVRPELRRMLREELKSAIRP